MKFKPVKFVTGLGKVMKGKKKWSSFFKEAGLEKASETIDGAAESVFEVKKFLEDFKDNLKEIVTITKKVFNDEEKETFLKNLNAMLPEWVKTALKKAKVIGITILSILIICIGLIFFYLLYSILSIRSMKKSLAELTPAIKKLNEAENIPFRAKQPFMKRNHQNEVFFLGVTGFLVLFTHSLIKIFRSGNDEEKKRAGMMSMGILLTLGGVSYTLRILKEMKKNWGEVSLKKQGAV